MRRIDHLFTTIGLFAALFAAPAAAADPAGCQRVRLAEVGWTDIAATTALASRILEGLGYRAESRTLTVPGVYAAMKAGSVDAFLGQWMPSMEADSRAAVADGSVEVAGANLSGAKFTLAVPSDLYEAGLRSFEDIARFRDRLKGKIHGIEAGNDGNRLILGMIAANTFGLGNFELVESSETGMLAHVERAVAAREPIVFLGWAPHPMNVRFSLSYLSGGDAVFGRDFGGATVFTNTRRGYAGECPNAGAFLKNLRFTLDIENRVMGSILSQGIEPAKAAETWLKDNPAAWSAWLDGVTTFEGRPGVEAVKRSLGLGTP